MLQLRRNSGRNPFKGTFLKSQYIQVYDFLDPYLSDYLQQILFLVPISIATIKLCQMCTWAQKYWYPIWEPNVTHVLKFVPILFQAFQAYDTKGRSCSSSTALLLPITTMYLRGLIVKMVKFLWRMTNSDCQTNSFNEVRWRSPKSKTIQKVGSKKDWSHDPSINPFGTWCSFTRWCVYTLYEWNWSICRANES